VHALVVEDEFVGEAEAGHEVAPLELGDGAEGAREADTLDAGEGDEAAGKTLAAVDPVHDSVGLAADGGHGVDGTEDAVLLGAVADAGVEPHPRWWMSGAKEPLVSARWCRQRRPLLAPAGVGKGADARLAATSAEVGVEGADAATCAEVGVEGADAATFVEVGVEDADAAT